VLHEVLQLDALRLCELPERMLLSLVREGSVGDDALGDVLLDGRTPVVGRVSGVSWSLLRGSRSAPGGGLKGKDPESLWVGTVSGHERAEVVPGSGQTSRKSRRRMSEASIPGKSRTASTESLWTGERHDLARALQEIDVTIGAFYRQAIDSLSVLPRRLVDVALAGHCVRELVAALPSALADVDGLPDRVNESKPIWALVKVWDRHRDVLGEAHVPLRSGARGELTQPSLVSVPIDLLDASRLVVLARKTGTMNNDVRHGALVLGRLDGSDVAVRIFKRSVRFFIGYTHLSGLLDRELPDDELVERHLAVIEEALHARLGRFFTTAESIMADLEVANRRRQS
jgi:hypothetical protein